VTQHIQQEHTDHTCTRRLLGDAPTSTPSRPTTTQLQLQHCMNCSTRQVPTSSTSMLLAQQHSLMHACSLYHAVVSRSSSCAVGYAKQLQQLAGGINDATATEAQITTRCMPVRPAVVNNRHCMDETMRQQCYQGAAQLVSTAQHLNRCGALAGCISTRRTCCSRQPLHLQRATCHAALPSLACMRVCIPDATYNSLL
jgi:hypothetical protein